MQSGKTSPKPESKVKMDRPAAAATAAADYKRQVEAARKSIANLERQHDLRGDALASERYARHAALGQPEDEYT
jgi:hypothetical protein